MKGKCTLFAAIVIQENLEDAPRQVVEDLNLTVADRGPSIDVQWILWNLLYKE